MTKRSVYNKKGPLLFAGPLFAFCLVGMATSSLAQGTSTQQLSTRLNQLENQVQTLSRSVYRGAPPPAGAMSSDTGASAAGVYDTRIADIEQKQRQMTGQLEEATYRIEELKTQMEKMQRDYDMRLQQLEGGGVSSSSYGTSTNSTAELIGNPVVGGDVAPASGNTLGTLGSGSSSTPEALYEDAFADIRGAKYAVAEGKFRRFVSSYSTHPLASNAQYWLAETFYVRGDYKESSRLFAQGYQDYPKGAKASDSLLKLGLSLSRLDRKEDACLSFEQLKKEFPGDTAPASRRASQEMKRLGCG